MRNLFPPGPPVPPPGTPGPCRCCKGGRTMVFNIVGQGTFVLCPLCDTGTGAESIGVTGPPILVQALREGWA